MTKNNQLNKLQKTLSNVHFDDVFEKPPKQKRQHEGSKCRRSTFAQKQEHNNAATWQIDSLKRLLAKIDKNPNRILSMILDM